MDFRVPGSGKAVALSAREKSTKRRRKLMRVQRCSAICRAGSGNGRRKAGLEWLVDGGDDENAAARCRRVRRRLQGGRRAWRTCAAQSRAPTARRERLAGACQQRARAPARHGRTRHARALACRHALDARHGKGDCGTRSTKNRHCAKIFAVLRAACGAGSRPANRPAQALKAGNCTIVVRKSAAGTFMMQCHKIYSPRMRVRAQTLVLLGVATVLVP